MTEEQQEKPVGYAVYWKDGGLSFVSAEDPEPLHPDQVKVPLVHAPVRPPWWARELNRRAEVEQQMLDAAKKGKPIEAEQIQAWAMRLGVPDDWRTFGRKGS